jgi:hypothetical protein
MPVHNFYADDLRKNNRNPGKLLLQGALVDEATEHVVTCGLDTFDQYMRTVYPDWPEFVDWAMERTGRYGRWWAQPELP